MTPDATAACATYSVRVTDPGMAPRYCVGEVLYLDPSREVSNGDCVLLQFRGEQPNSIKWAGRAAGEAHGQFTRPRTVHPPKTFEIPIDDDMMAIHRIVGMGEG